MKKHVRAMTYPPKISAVRSGECRQTIREGDKVSEGDEVLWHGWEGLPYRSKWNWRMRVTVTNVIPIVIDWSRGISHFDTPDRWCGWDSAGANSLAVKDFISPATGYALRDVLSTLNGKKPRFDRYQIIRW